MLPSIRLSRVKNVATETELLPGVKEPLLEVVEYGEHTLSFVIKGQFNTGHIALIAGQMKIDKDTVPFEATGRVLSATKVTEEKYKIQIELKQYNKTVWQRFLTAIRKHQGKADKIFDKIRGEE